MKSILIIDDEHSVRDSIRMILEYEGYGVNQAVDGEIGLKEIAEHHVDLVLLDVKMPGMDGLEVLQQIKDRSPDIPVVMVSGHGTLETAVEATKLGAFDFLSKPLDRDKLLVVVRNALKTANLSKELRSLEEVVRGKYEILGSSKPIKEILSLVNRVAPTDARVMITGENGTGKELVARALHAASKRSDKPFVEVNCAAIPADLIESELFGHEKGSFTGATTQRMGKFEQADGGTLFLDEIGDMSVSAQAKVLRALEEQTIERVGGNKLITVDVRVLAATNKDLPAASKEGAFRNDLYHRLNVIPVTVPPLRERREDIPTLITAFLDEVCSRNGMAGKTIAEDGIRLLTQKNWPGNVRELRNTIERLVILSPGNEIDMRILDSGGSREEAMEGMFGAELTFQEFKDKAEAAFILRKLESNGWNISKTAESLDIQRSHLYTKMKRYGLAKGEDQE